MSTVAPAMGVLDVAGLPLVGVQLIEASAGTGKTHAITSLYLRLLLEARLTVADILVVTFTRAATAELRGRIRRRLVAALALLEDGAALAAEEDRAFAAIVSRAAGTAEESGRRLRSAIAAIDEAAVFTIHGFCQRALRDHAFESGQTFTAELTESESTLLASVVADWWRRTFYGDAELASLAATGERLATPAAVLAWLEPLRTRQVEILRLPPVERAALGPAAAGLRAEWQRGGADILATLAACTDLSRSQRARQGLEQAAAALDRWVLSGGIAPAREAGGLGQAAIHGLVTEAKRKRGLRGPELAFSQALDAHLAALEALEYALLRDALESCRESLDRIKRQRNVLAFDDLVRRLFDALRGPGGERLAGQVARRYRAALIDEFQDTDPVQFGIFEHIYRDRPDTGLFLIGDPKQAIYSFRGADIYAYVRAKSALPPSARHTMGVNWRSTRRLVAAVNTLFARSADPFLFAPDILYQGVGAGGLADRRPLLVDGVQPVPLRFWVPDGEGPVGSGAYREQAARAVAASCVELLAGARAGDVRLGERPLRPRDIAVLVRSAREGGQIQAALRSAGVGSALTSRDSVFASAEARDLAAVLDAALDPRDEGQVRRALASPLWGMNATEIERSMRDDEVRERCLASLQEDRRIWMRAGPLPMLRRWLQREGVAARLLARPGGERALTNLLHLADLLQRAAARQPTPEALRQWLGDALAGESEVGEEQELRLESDENLVQIVTQHKSKGLEYPVVFLPFAALATRGGKDPLPLYHDAAAGGRLVLDHADPDRARAQAERERLAEDLRLLYVSLTRATHLCVVAWGAVKPAQGYVYPALAHLLHARPGQTPAEADEDYRAVRDDGPGALRAHLEALAGTCPEGIAVAAPPAAGRRLPPEPADTAAFRARSVQRVVADDWCVTSYSELARLTAEEHPESPLPPLADTRPSPPPETIAAFPRGRRAGLLFHGLLEDLDFTCRDATVLRELAATHLRRGGFDEDWAQVLAGAVRDVLDTPLAEGLRLGDLEPARRRSEMEFCYPIHRLSGRALLQAVPALAGTELSTPRFTFSPRSGLMKGFVDLVFEHQGRYYLADWKTNWLGGGPADYTPERLDLEMRRHHYDLQYYVYAVALHRYLARRIPDYSYARHMGGVYYYFVRGMTPATGMQRGVFFARPAADSLTALDAVFAGGPP